MAEQDNSINVERIVEEIREDIKNNHRERIDFYSVLKEIEEEAASIPRENIPSFEDIPIDNLRADEEVLGRAKSDSTSQVGISILQQLRNEADYLKANAENPYNWDIGRGLKGFIKRIVRRMFRFLFFPLLERQNAFNDHTANGIDAARIMGEEQQHLFHELSAGLGHMRDCFQQTESQIEQAELKIGQLELRVHQLEMQNQKLTMHQGALDRTLDQLSLSIPRVIRFYMEKNQEIQREENSIPSTSLESEDATQIYDEAATGQSSNEYNSIDYFQFQNDFRGTQSQIMERQKEYVSYFKNKRGKILDFGCGRGEFLRLLKDTHIPAFGVDTYAEYEVLGQLYDVDIVAGDGMAILEAQTEPLGGIFSAQVIEHLGFSTVEKLCTLAYEKLETGGCMILESPNPMSLSAMTNAFYLDPTHDKPVHPLLMEYLLKKIGFSEIRILWPDHSLPQLPKIESDEIKNISEVNSAIDRVSNMLFGSQDYAIVAIK